MSDDEHSMLARLDERVKSMQAELHASRIEAAEDIAAVLKKFGEYVRMERFRTTELIVFGFAGLILSSVIAAVIATVLHR